MNSSLTKTRFQHRADFHDGSNELMPDDINVMRLRIMNADHDELAWLMHDIKRFSTRIQHRIIPAVQSRVRKLSRDAKRASRS